MMQLSNLPDCRICHGRHRGRGCPNFPAKQDKSFDGAEAERNGTKCNYSDPVYKVVCYGKGTWQDTILPFSRLGESRLHRGTR